MAEKMNGFNFGMTMKKIFFAIIALAALVGCNTNVMEEVTTTPQYLTTSFEVDLNGESRVFNENLEWSWTKDDQIAAYQDAGDKIVNTLSLKTNGKFGTEQFTYVPDVTADFVFVYPVEALNADKSLGYVQTGVWTPTLVGIVENATVNNIGRVDMTHMSAAFEIRVWDEGRKTPKNIKAATITSELDFCDGTTATVEGLDDTNTVVFNIAEGNFAFNLTLTATDGKTYTVAVPTKNFKNGQRTILNVEWKNPKPATVSYNIYTSYTNKDNSLDGRTIYVKDVVLTNADSAAIELYLNDNKAADLTPGKTTTVSNLALGEYKAVVKWTVNGKEYTSGETKVYVTGIPYTLNPKANDNWNAWSDVTGNSNIDWNVDGTLRLGYNVESASTWGCSVEAAIQKTFFVPFDTNVVVNSTGSVCGSGSKGWLVDSRVNTTFTLSVSGSTAYSVKSTDGGTAQNYSSGDKRVSMSASNATVKLHNSYSTASGRTSVKTLTIKY